VSVKNLTTSLRTGVSGGSVGTGDNGLLNGLVVIKGGDGKVQPAIARQSSIEYIHHLYLPQVRKWLAKERVMHLSSSISLASSETGSENGWRKSE